MLHMRNGDSNSSDGKDYVLVSRPFATLAVWISLVSCQKN